MAPPYAIRLQDVGDHVGAGVGGRGDAGEDREHHDRGGDRGRPGRCSWRDGAAGAPNATLPPPVRRQTSHSPDLQARPHACTLSEPPKIRLRRSMGHRRGARRAGRVRVRSADDGRTPPAAPPTTPSPTSTPPTPPAEGSRSCSRSHGIRSPRTWGCSGGRGSTSSSDDVRSGRGRHPLRTTVGASDGGVGRRPPGGVHPPHGNDHRIPAHRVEYRANVWAMAALGVKALIAPFACGSLRPELRRGDLVMVDQFVDRTTGRAGTFFDGPETWHQEHRRPLRRRAGGHHRHGGGVPGPPGPPGSTVVVIPGPASRPGPNRSGTGPWAPISST